MIKPQFPNSIWKYIGLAALCFVVGATILLTVGDPTNITVLIVAGIFPITALVLAVIAVIKHMKPMRKYLHARTLYYNSKHSH